MSIVRQLVLQRLSLLTGRFWPMLLKKSLHGVFNPPVKKSTSHIGLQTARERRLGVGTAPIKVTLPSLHAAIAQGE
ncbi:hypothetical protein [Paraburkholderia sediminicola]|uniref:hypothetical protein n=1 Tax=Paraburkholderia sediminicola TaxID=458836 RepID=UPI0038B9CBF0